MEWVLVIIRVLCAFFMGRALLKMRSAYNTDKANTTRSITKLEVLGYMERYVDIEDRCAYKVYLAKRSRESEPTIRRILKKEWT